MPDKQQASDVAEQIARGIAQSPRTSATPAGQDDATPRDQLIDAINQVFALFRLNYHNQFYAAYPDGEQLTLIKRLWLETLEEYPCEVILGGAKRAIEDSEYLPTLHLMRECCQQSLAAHGVPQAREAFLEACQKPSPKREQNWSHPVVYLAGRDSDWFFLANNAEKQTWPVFQKCYTGYLKRLSQGQSFSIPSHDELAAPKPDAMSGEERLAALQALRKEVQL